MTGSRKSRPKRKKASAEFFHDGEPVPLQHIRQLSLDDARSAGFLAESEVLRIVGISQSTVRRWRQRGVLTAKKVGKTWLYSRESVLRVVTERT